MPSGEPLPAPPGVSIERVLEATPEVTAALAALLPLLSSAPAPDLEALQALLADPTTSLFLARDVDGSVIGTLTLAVTRLLAGTRALIEDVIVDERGRGRGIGAALVNEALRTAATAGARTVDLTSRPSREAANRLYERCGFEQRRTNVWRRRLDG